MKTFHRKAGSKHCSNSLASVVTYCSLGTAAVSVSLALFFINGCGGSPKITGPLGCATIDELVNRYKGAHEAKDLNALRSICYWNVQRKSWPASYSHHEEPMTQIFDFAIRDVKYIEGPEPPPDLGGEVIYYIPGEKKQDKMIGPVYGKLVLIGENGQHVDPSYVVMKFQGRYYIDVLLLVLQDAAHSLQANVEPKYVAAPLERVPDPRKGEKARRFD